MWTRRLRSISERGALCAILVAGACASRDASADEISAAKLAASTPSNRIFAGVALDKLTIPALHLRTRDDHAADRGGITMSFADDQNEVQVVVKLAVASDAAGARAFATGVLHGVAGVLEPSTIDELAFGEPTDRYLVATHGNVGYVIDVLGTSARASAIATIVKSAIVAGAPSFPSAKLKVSSSMNHADPAGSPLSVSISTGATHRLRASGAYVARSREGALVIHPHAAGPIEITAIASDALGRVTETTARTTSQ